MKSLIASLCILGMIGTMIGLTVWAVDYKEISCSVTGKKISIAQGTPGDSSITYGTVALSGSTSTDVGVGGTGTADPEAFENNGSGDELFKVYSTGTGGGATEWTLGESAGSNVFVHSFATTSAPVSYWQTLSADSTYETASSTVSAGAQVTFYFKIDMPTDADNFTKTITLKVMAE